MYMYIVTISQYSGELVYRIAPNFYLHIIFVFFTDSSPTVKIILTTYNTSCIRAHAHATTHRTRAFIVRQSVNKLITVVSITCTLWNYYSLPPVDGKTN